MKRALIVIFLALSALSGCGESDELSKAKKRNNENYAVLQDAQYFADTYPKQMRDDADHVIRNVIARLMADATVLNESAPQYEQLAIQIKNNAANLRTNEKDTLETLASKRTKMVELAKTMNELLFKTAQAYKNFYTDAIPVMGEAAAKAGTSYKTYEAHTQLIEKLYTVK